MTMVDGTSYVVTVSVFKREILVERDDLVIVAKTEQQAGVYGEYIIHMKADIHAEAILMLVAM